MGLKEQRESECASSYSALTLHAQVCQGLREGGGKHGAADTAGQEACESLLPVSYWANQGLAASTEPHKGTSEGLGSMPSSWPHCPALLLGSGPGSSLSSGSCSWLGSGLAEGSGRLLGGNHGWAICFLKKYIVNMKKQVCPSGSAGLFCVFPSCPLVALECCWHLPRPSHPQLREALASQQRDRMPGHPAPAGEPVKASARCCPSPRAGGLLFVLPVSNDHGFLDFFF